MSKSIIEKLGITPGPWEEGNQCDSVISKSYRSAENDHMGSRDYYGGYCICESIEQRNRNVIASAPEMLESHIKDIEWMERCLEFLPNELNKNIHLRIGLKIRAIEKACYPKTWSEIKELLNA